MSAVKNCIPKIHKSLGTTLTHDDQKTDQLASNVTVHASLLHEVYGQFSAIVFIM